LKTVDAAADDTGSRADNPNRTFLGATQLAWLKQTLLAGQNNGTTWKFVSVSDPIDQLGPIGGSLSGTLTSVNADGGKSYMGGYRAERKRPAQVHSGQSHHQRGIPVDGRSPKPH
jgi:phosphodiesterase/alkaline phosphatase D-like protein